MWFKWTLLLFFIYIVHCDDGLCGLEPPKERESCSGSTEDTEENGKDTVLKYEQDKFTNARIPLRKKRDFFTNSTGGSNHGDSEFALLLWGSFDHLN